MSIKNIKSSNVVPADLAKKLGKEGIGVILSTMWLGYHDLKRDNRIDVAEDEDSITIKWYEKVYDRWNSENRASQVHIRLIPINQYPDRSTQKEKRGKAPAIDFCFKEWGQDESYFGAECKRIKSKDNRLIREYVENGVKRFTSGKYSSRCSASAMIGYVQEGSISDIVVALTLAIKNADIEQNLTRMMAEADPEYTSIHRRSNVLSNITLYHLFFDFSTTP